MKKITLKKDDIYVIAETANSHEGSVEYLEKSIKAISSVRGINAVKFHIMTDVDSYATPDHPLYKFYKKILIKHDDWKRLILMARDRGLDVIVLVDDLASFDFVLSIENIIDGIELHSVSLNDITMLTEAAKFKKRIFLGIGGSTVPEISFAVDFLMASGKSGIILMCGYQSYPTRNDMINLRRITRLSETYKLPIGFGDHTAWNDPDNELVTLSSLIYGAKIIEKHFVLEAGKKRTDYEAAVSEDYFAELRRKINVIMRSGGTGILELNKYEREYSELGFMRKAIVASKYIPKSGLVTPENIAFKRTKNRASVAQLDAVKLIGRKAIKTIEKNDFITFKNTVEE